MIKDGLWDAFHGYHMGQTAENIATRWQITREDQDSFAVASQNKAEARAESRSFTDEIAPVTIKARKGDTVVTRTNTSATASPMRASAAFDPPSARRAR